MRCLIRIQQYPYRRNGWPLSDHYHALFSGLLEIAGKMDKTAEYLLGKQTKMQGG